MVVTMWCCDVAPWSAIEVGVLKSLLETIKPDIVGLSTRCVYEDRINEIAEAIKGFTTIAGGHDATFRPELYKKIGFDFVCIGDGEDAIVDLANGKDAKKINNLFGSEKSPVKTDPIYFGFPDSKIVHYLVENNIYNVKDPYKPPFYFTMFGKGCTGNCAFCSAGQYNKLHKTSRTLRKIEDVVSECREAESKGFEKVYFLDSFFTATHKILIDFFNQYKGLPKFFAQLNPNQVVFKPEILDAAVDAGLFQTVVGFQSGSECINKTVFNRPTDNNILMQFAQMCLDRDVEIHYHFLTHNPFESDTDRKKTMDLLGKIPKGDKAGLILRPLKIFANTELSTYKYIDDTSFADHCWWLEQYITEYQRKNDRI